MKPGDNFIMQCVCAFLGLKEGEGERKEKRKKEREEKEKGMEESAKERMSNNNGLFRYVWVHTRVHALSFPNARQAHEAEMRKWRRRRGERGRNERRETRINTDVRRSGRM